MAEPDLLIEAGFSDAKLAQETRKLLDKYRDIGKAAQKVFQDSQGSVSDNQALKAHMRELDKLQRAYDPVYTATQKYNAALTKLDRALQIGAIDQAKYTAEVKRAQVELGQVSGAIQTTERSTRSFGGNLQNIGFQVGDFATQVGAGTSATQALGQQLPQLLGGFGAVGAVAGAAAAILIPLAGALLGAGEKAQTLDEQLEALEKSTDAMTSAAAAAAVPIDELREKYGDLADEVQRANQAMATITAESAKRDALAAARRLGGELGDLPNLNAYIGSDGTVRQGYENAYAKGLAQGVAQLGKDLGATEDEAKALMAAVNQLGRGGTLDALVTESDALATALAAITPETAQQQAALQAMANQVAPIMDAASAQVAASADTAVAAQQKVIDKYAETTTKLKELAADRALAVEAAKSADAAIAKGAQEAIRAIDAQIRKVKELAAANDDMMERGRFWSGPYQAPPSSAPSATVAARDMIGRFEGGHVAQPYWDVNKYRAGYGSETYTGEDGIARAVVKGVQVSREDADRDLDRRILAYFEEQRRIVGPAWITFSDQQKAALASVQHNYGNIPARIRPALATGDAQTIATALAGLAMDYTRDEARDGTPQNYNRRMQEAAEFGDTSAQAGRNQDSLEGERKAASERQKALDEEVRKRERQVEVAKQLGDQLAANLLTTQQTADLDARRAQGMQAIADAGLTGTDRAAAVAQLNGELERQETVWKLLADAKRRNVDVDGLVDASQQQVLAGLLGLQAGTITYRQAIEALGAAQQARIVTEQQVAAAAAQTTERQEFLAQMQTDLKNGLLDAIVAGESFADVLANVAQMLARAALQAALFNEGPFAGGGGGGLLGGLFKTGFGSLFGGFRATGGSVSPNKVYMVGERGPELFAPPSMGSIIPNNKLNAGGPMSINITVAGARGNAEIEEMVASGVHQGLSAYDKTMPARVQGIQARPRRR